jgi:MSHA biogenesis protein MshK
MNALVPWAALLLGLAPAAQAQALADPTRPPHVAPGKAGNGAGEAGAAFRLESVLISPSRRLAVIDGRTVAVGGKVHDATVVEITETYALLRQGGEVKRLLLYPGIERRPTKTAEAAGKKREDRP